MLKIFLSPSKILDKIYLCEKLFLSIFTKIILILQNQNNSKMNFKNSFYTYKFGQTRPISQQPTRFNQHRHSKPSNKSEPFIHKIHILINHFLFIPSQSPIILSTVALSNSLASSSVSGDSRFFFRFLHRYYTNRLSFLVSNENRFNFDGLGNNNEDSTENLVGVSIDGESKSFLDMQQSLYARESLSLLISIKNPIFGA